MIVPTMGQEYIIEDPAEFFMDRGEKVAEIDLKPFIHISQFLVNKSKDFYKKLVISTSDTLNLSNDVDISNNLPAGIYKAISLSVNGSFILGVCQKLLTVDLNTNLFYDEDSGRITLTSLDDRLVFLIQGLSE
jgi:hypothetical protein